MSCHKRTIISESESEKVLIIQPVKCFVLLARFEIKKPKEQSLDTFIPRSRMFLE